MKDKVIILKDPVLVERDINDNEESKSNGDNIKLTPIDDDGCIIVDGPKMTGPCEVKND